jgi:hypothetical protein
VGAGEGLIIIKLDIEIWVIGKGGTKNGVWEKRWMGGGIVRRLLGSNFST